MSFRNNFDHWVRVSYGLKPLKGGGNDFSGLEYYYLKV